ncbi:MAG: hypothetical protein HN617_13705 [Planctomycetaceae bacterium]|jgi:hypothetical protein|nr:hypothetical protein [Planctomycetaceae bacterium]MBT4014062.1 hypothetical protein [Planctomycetaceae bacterium]MBT4724764.1 hypothetical protein [Planctomycetaceae bacterium]MBT5124324.1 hypothetical protein [Planctomycetaceae bacterium]MBT5599129.1 hypothetical protein [Planctomycetaceae bacterium]
MPDRRQIISEESDKSSRVRSNSSRNASDISRNDDLGLDGLSRRELAWLILPALLLITIRLMLWHQYFDKDTDGSRKFIEGREAVTGMHCANDRSRWAAVVSLVHQGSWSIDDVERLRGSSGNWGTIDKVYHIDSSGVEHFYSSKPPLYILFVASQYWVLNRTFGVDILQNPLWGIKGLVFLNQVLLFGIFLWLYLVICQRFVRQRSVLICLGLTAGFGTFLSTFAVSLNNHLPAAVCTLAVICLLIRIEDQPKRIEDHTNTGWLNYFCVGVMTALCVTFELPALSFLGLVGIWLLIRSPIQTLTFGAAGIGVVAFAFFGCNYWAHGSLRPPYAHRSDGEVLASLEEADKALLVAGVVPESLALRWRRTDNDGDLHRMSNIVIEQHPTAGRWRIFDIQNRQRYALQQVGSKYEIRDWDNWYDYEVNGRASYWLPGAASGVDLGEPSRLLYLVHMTIGHHGIFSLTPIWLFSLIGIAVAWRDPEPIWRRFAYVLFTLIVVLIGFYTLRPLADRNYGGVASGFRWFFWLTPLFLLMLIPAWNVVRKSMLLMVLWGICLALSIYSGLHGFLNPWQHPWYFTP